MIIQVRFSTGLAQHVGQPRLHVVLNEGATMADLLQQLRDEHASLRQPLASAVPVLGGRHVTESERLQDGQEVALLLPIAGG